MFRKLAYLIASIGPMMCFAVLPANAMDLVYGSFFGAKAGENRIGVVPTIKEIAKASNGTIKWKLLAGGQVVTGRGTLAAIRDKLIDSGLVVAPFTRKELATNNTVFDMGFHGTDVVAVSGASVETILVNCPECLAEYKRNNAVFVGGYALSPFRLMCAKKVASLADIANKKIRAVGSTARWIKLLGGAPVSIPAPEAVPAMQRGALDCAVASPGWLTALGYMDVTKSVIDFTFGSPRGIGLWVLNRKSWDAMSLDQKNIMLKAMPMSQARLTIDGYVKNDKRNFDLARAKGITITKGGPEFDAKLAVHIVNEEKAIPAQLRKLGVKNPERIMAAFKTNLKKWEALSKGIGTDVEKFAKALQTHIYDKVDPGKL
jgi:TRAP-type C4-dicarboxylate transport system substrate-binding protein